VISRERDTHAHTERARTWYTYVVYKPLFSRTFVFFRKREILCRVLMKRRSLCCSYFKAEKCWISDFCFILMREHLNVWLFTFLIFFNDRLATWREERYFKGNYALCCGHICWRTDGAKRVKKGLYERFLFPHFNLSLVVEDDDDDERDDGDDEEGKEVSKLL
jgi:hypothetical protein